MKKATVIAIMSPKGGVGKTTTSINIAMALALLNHKVLIIDTNLETPHVAVHYGFSDFNYALQDVLNGTVQMEKAIYHNDKISLDIIPSRIFKKLGDGNADYKLINLFHHLNQIRDKYDFVVLDSRPSSSLDFIKLINDVNVLLVTLPEITSVIEAKKLKEKIEENKIKVLGIVINKVNIKNESNMSKSDIEHMVRTKIVGEVPEEPKMSRALMTGTPITVLNTKSKTAASFMQIASNIASIRN